jgi:signal transduction histidine kinase
VRLSPEEPMQSGRTSARFVGVKRLAARFDRESVIDAGVPVALAAMGLVEVLGSGAFDDDPRAVVACAVLALTLPLVVRRRWPIPVLVLVLCWATLTSVAWNLFDDTAFGMGVLLVASYSVAAYCGLRDAAIGGFILVGWGALAVAVDDVPVGDYLFVGLILGGVWAAGRTVRSRRQLAAALADKNVLLEHEQEARAKQAVAEERTRIARELHDVVAHSVSVMVVHAGAERRALGDERPDTREALETIEHTGRLALTEMRRLLGMLRQDDDELALAPQPSLRHLDLLISQVRDAGMPVELDVEGEPQELPPGVDLSAYRIVQEALTNALKHAGPAQALVRVRYRRDELELEIVDDGSGVSESNGSGHGLIGMRERVSMFGGNLDTGRSREGGYAVRARLPLGR